MQLTPEGTICPRHPGNAALGTCSRCGRFFCAECGLEAEGTSPAHCEDCEEAVRGERRSSSLKRLYRGLSVAEATRALVIVVMVGLSMSSHSPEQRTSAYLGLAVVLVPFVALAVLLWISPKRLVAWLAVAWDVAVFGGFAAWTFLQNPSAPPVMVAFALLPLGTFLRALRIHRMTKAGEVASTSA
jgi:hypothetical protein